MGVGPSHTVLPGAGMGRQPAASTVVALVRRLADLRQQGTAVALEPTEMQQLVTAVAAVAGQLREEQVADLVLGLAQVTAPCPCSCRQCCPHDTIRVSARQR